VQNGLFWELRSLECGGLTPLWLCQNGITVIGIDKHKLNTPSQSFQFYFCGENTSFAAIQFRSPSKMKFERLPRGRENGTTRLWKNWDRHLRDR
jgi:hypothetical protein